MAESPRPKKKPRKVKGCYNCSQRRINCDRGSPCHKCVKKNLQCSGPGLRYRFNDGVASRGKLAGRSLPIHDSSPNSSTRSKEPSPGQQSLINPEIDTVTWIDSGVNIETSVQTITHHINKKVPFFLDESPGPTLDHISRQSRFLLEHFAKKVAPAMVAINRVFNGYRDLILPLSEQDDTVHNAILATSASHLSLRHTEWKEVASQHRMAAIKGLNKKAPATNLDAEAAQSNLSTMVLLLVDEMVTVGADFFILLRMVKSFIESLGGLKTLEVKPLGNFLVQQIRKMSLYSGPLISEHTAIRSLDNISRQDLDFLYSCLETHPDHAPVIHRLASPIHMAAQTYLARATGKPHPVIVSLVQQFLVETSTFNATSPGGHILIWPFFIVGAKCTLERDREFVTAQLRSLWDCTGFGSTLYAIKVLRMIWQDDTGAIWTQSLTGRVQGFIM